MKTIARVEYKNKKKSLDFEIVDLHLFFSTRPKKMLEIDFRLNFWAILYITDGSGVHHVDFNSYTYNKGDVIFIQKIKYIVFRLMMMREVILFMLMNLFFIK